jgi:hypothetical protein
MHQLPLYPSFYGSEVEKLLDNTDGEVMQEYAILSMAFTLARQRQRQDKIRQEKTKTRQNKTKAKTRQDKTRQDKTRQDMTRQDRTGQDNHYLSRFVLRFVIQSPIT